MGSSVFSVRATLLSSSLRLQGARRPNVMMLVWGFAIGLLTSFVLFVMEPGEWPIMGSRATGLRDSLAVLVRGGPLLLGRHGAAGSFYAIGVGDDDGIYVYLPLLSRLFRVADPVLMLRYAYAVLYGLSAAVYPIIFYKLTRSLLAGFTAPLILLVCVRSMGFHDIYWVPAWGVLTLLPVVFLLARDWPRFGVIGLLGVAFVASWLSSIRNSSGLGIMAAAVIVLLLRRWTWWRVLPALALLTVIYFSINTFALNAIREHRDRQLGTYALDRYLPISHPLWHTAYLGLGYLPNNYDIHFNDSIAAARVQRDAPGTVYLSNRYASVLHKAYFKILREHPGEVVKQYVAKVIVTVADTALYLLLVLLTAPAMLLLGPEQRIRRRWVLLTVPAAIIGFMATMVAIPSQGYEEGLYGVLGVIGTLGLCWTLAQLEIIACGRGGVRTALSGLYARWCDVDGWRDPLRRSVRASAVAIIALTLVIVGGHFIRQSAERWQGFSSGVLIDAVRFQPPRATASMQA